MFRRARYTQVIDSQLDLFEHDHRDVIDEADARLDAYNAAGRDEAEELYGDYLDAVETGTELLADMRDHYARSLDDPDGYLREFNKAVERRLPPVRAGDREPLMAERIEDYALVGDLQTAALIGREGSVDWLCFPRFDSGSCFGALLGTHDHGHWGISPIDGGPATARRYRPDTLILESEWQTTTGRVRVIDFMPPRGRAPDIVRIVEGLDGTVEMTTELVIRFDYGSVVPWVRRLDDDTLLAIGGPDALALRTPVDLEPERDDAPGRRSPSTQASASRSSSRGSPSHHRPPQPVDAERALRETEAYWLKWFEGCAYEGEYHEAVHVSLAVLKALTYEPTGGIVAAPTTSLPEQIGGVRNWDYRFTWLRDATFTLFALMNAGFTDEARAWRNWLLRAVAGDPANAQILYGVAGERRVPRARSSSGCPGTQARRRFASATPRTSSSSSTCTAR